MAPEQVHIQPAAPNQSARQVDHRRLAQPADPAALPAAVLDLPASLEYASGCQRSHSRVLGAAVRQPFAVASAARALPGGGLALQCTLSSNMAVPASLAKLVSTGGLGLVVAHRYCMSGCQKGVNTVNQHRNECVQSSCLSIPSSFCADPGAAARLHRGHQPAG